MGEGTENNEELPSWEEPMELHRHQKINIIEFHSMGFKYAGDVEICYSNPWLIRPKNNDWYYCIDDGMYKIKRFKSGLLQNEAVVNPNSLYISGIFYRWYGDYLIGKQEVIERIIHNGRKYVVERHCETGPAIKIYTRNDVKTWVLYGEHYYLNGEYYLLNEWNDQVKTKLYW